MLKNAYRNFLLFLVSPCQISLAWIPWVLCIGGFAIWCSAPLNCCYGTAAMYWHGEQGIYGNWHPPIMATTWRFFIRIAGDPVLAQKIFTLFEAVVLWSGVLAVFLLGHQFWKNETPRKTWGVMIVSIVFIGWVTFNVLGINNFVVMKDKIMLGVYLLATCLLLNWSHWSLHRWQQWLVALVVLLLITYGTTLRHNAVFAVIPLLFWLVWSLFPLQRKSFFVITTGLVLWVGMCIGIHHFNYSLLKAVNLYPLQERFYADIFLLNHKTKKFVLPPNTFGNNFDELSEDIFYEKFDTRHLFIQRAFGKINKEIDIPLRLWQEFLIIVPQAEFDHGQNVNFHPSMHPLLKQKWEEKQELPSAFYSMGIDDVRETFPEDYVLLRRAWLDRILMDPVPYLRMKTAIFRDFCLGTSLRYCIGITAFNVLMVILSMTIFFTCSKSRLHPSVFPMLMLCWSAVLYILPLWMFLPDTGLRYLYWFFAPSLIAIVLFCANSELIRTILRLIANYWETKLRSIAYSLK